MKKLLALISMFSFVVGKASANTVKNIDPTPEPKRKISPNEIMTAKRLEQARLDRELAFRYGLKEFNIEGIVVYAMNQKNAEKKANKVRVNSLQHV